MRPIKKASTDQSIVIRIIDSTDGTPETGVVWNTAGIDMWYRRELAVSVDITEATLAALTTAHTDGGFLHINDGYYRLDLPDAAVATGVNGVMVGGTVTGMIVIGCYISLVDYDPYDGVRAGLTALPNAAADGALGLPISDAGGLDLDTKLADTNEVTAARMGALTDWINGGRLDLLLDAIKVVTDNLTDLDAIADAVWDEILTGATHNVATSAGRRLRQIQEAQGYENGSIWIDTVNGTAGTVDYENGTVENPVDSIADANTIAASLNMSQFTIISGSSITLAAAQQNQTFFGHNWTLALGGQAIGGTFFQGAVVSGIGTGMGYLFVNCEVGIVTLAAGTCKECRFTATASGGFTISAAGTFHFLDCKSAIAGSGAPVWTFPGSGSSFLNFRNYSGGIQFEAMTVNDTATIESRGQFIEGTCTAGTVVMRGTQTISGITNITLTDDARFDQTQVFAAVLQTVLTQPTDVATMGLTGENLLYSAFKRFFYEHVITVATGVLQVKNADDSEFSAQATLDNGTIQQVGKAT